MKGVHDAGGERVIRADDREVDLFAFYKFDDRGVVGDGDGNIPGDARGAGVSRRAIDFRDPWRLRELPRERVLTTPGTDDEDLHRGG